VVRNLISLAKFQELAASSTVIVPCIVVKNNPTDGLILAAYQFTFEDSLPVIDGGDGNASLIQFNDSYTPELSLGDCVRFEQTKTECRLYPITPTCPGGITQLAEALAEFLPELFGN
jgi:hypothetical protein